MDTNLIIKGHDESPEGDKFTDSVRGTCCEGGPVGQTLRLGQQCRDARERDELGPSPEEGRDFHATTLP